METAAWNRGVSERELATQGKGARIAFSEACRNAGRLPEAQKHLSGPWEQPQRR